MSDKNFAHSRVASQGQSHHQRGARKVYRPPVINARLFYDPADGRKWKRRCEQKRVVWIAFLDISHGQTSIMAMEDQIARLKHIPRRTVRWVIRLLRTQGFLRDVRKHGLRDAMERELLPDRLGEHPSPGRESCRTSTRQSCRTRTVESCRVKAVQSIHVPSVEFCDSIFGKIPISPKSSSEVSGYAATPDDDSRDFRLREAAKKIFLQKPENAPYNDNEKLDLILDDAMPRMGTLQPSSPNYFVGVLTNGIKDTVRLEEINYVLGRRRQRRERARERYGLPETLSFPRHITEKPWPEWMRPASFGSEDGTFQRYFTEDELHVPSF